jgi:beta-aspartyl-peptidase (threonine type)
MLDFTIALHGGAGVITKDLDPSMHIAALQRVVTAAYAYASSPASEEFNAVDIAEHVVYMLENEPLFNAGLGSVLNRDGHHELEASIMDGRTLRCGAANMLTTVKHPISLTRAIMKNTPHICLSGEAAELFADTVNAEKVENSYFTTTNRVLQLELAKLEGCIVNDHAAFDKNQLEGENKGEGATGTVGCVVMYKGHVAAATSTGGMTNKWAGRIGDSAIIGAGTYANDATCAVSCTGKGEEFMRIVAAHDISARIEYGGRSLDAACRETVFKKLPAETGGVIAVNSAGECSMPYNSIGMFRAYCDSSRKCNLGIWEESIDVILPTL